MGKERSEGKEKKEGGEGKKEGGKKGWLEKRKEGKKEERRKKKGGDEGRKNFTFVLRKNWKEKVTTMRQTACPFFQSFLT